MTTAAAVGAPGSPRRYLHALWLLSGRDLKVRYSTSALGYLWSVLDPLVMGAIYWFVFTQVFERVGHDPYIVFLIAALLPWVWFNSSVSDFARAFSKDARLVRSTAIPRSIWINRIVLSKGIEFLCALPVLALFVVISLFTDTPAQISWGVLWIPAAVILQATLLVGVGLLVAPLCVLWNDLERTTKLILRALFYASPVIYSIDDLPAALAPIAALNPLSGIFALYRVGFFADEWDPWAIGVSAVMSFAFLALGLAVFRRLERPLLKEL